ncbi:MAG: DUF971 domain-containing protein [Burkholderiaceae bacterium]
MPDEVALEPAALRLRWGGEEHRIAAATLRAACRCAGCVARARRGEPVPPADAVALVDARPLGHYALQLVFDDGHDRGIYPWPMLRGLQARA